MSARRSIGVVSGYLSLLLVSGHAAAMAGASVRTLARLARLHRRLLRPWAFDQPLPLAIGQQRQSVVGAVHLWIGPDPMASFLSGQLVKELRGPGFLPETLIREGESDEPLRPGDAHIGDPAFLLQILIIDVRQHPLLHSDQEHRLPFEALGRMDGR